MDSEMRRPNPLRWLAYAFGARLPERHHRWVLHDVTCRTWVLRHLARTTVQLLPLLVVLYLVVPGPPWVRLGAIVSGALIGYFYSAVYTVEACETRVMKAGYPVGAAAATREARRSEQHVTERLRHDELHRDERSRQDRAG
ncbi:hypothetical protein Ae168Ps1_1421 [Pseudonocardia sp. Ae168_Ps1]|nr:hypothetical protein FRP1_06800 [Pseudonocardia sp. EC080625-04]ALL76211.1 hypothetical protein AD006_14420 [Pseudonocardia sp. EC080610-09]ALL83236.1 hypothetical protein AD017_22245 [Pseudonocardia sp. EC080619-01]OLL73040.1 hypothetical protein Ae150APs1_1418 [Pseudonocardia sp. Ae150A_Ps1]OLL79015.1 hypothetical protein Ae168Ps1_1421 [Pseudonocardia sp. Ae168_Ps1]OLL86847.1 hypothetical protein Ae263Ps1_3902c [Pseudonocardia sp. Ae263_Ps1]OLL93109.1 hypothetical protein Ae356Ps1_3006 [